MCSSAILPDHDFHRDLRITFTLFQSSRLVVDHIDNSPSFSPQQYQTHQDATSHKTTSTHPVTVQPSPLYPSIHVSCMAPECTEISLAVARFTSVTAARAREAREMHSVSIVSFGAELGRPSIRLMFNSSHNITIMMFRHQVCGIDCAPDLLDRELLVFLFLLQPKVLRFHMFDCDAPASESHLSIFALELRVEALVSCWPIRWPHLQSVPCCSILTLRCSVTQLSVLTTKLPRCVDQRASILQMSSASFSDNQQRQHRRVHQHDALFLLQRELPHGTCRVA